MPFESVFYKLNLGTVLVMWIYLSIELWTQGVTVIFLLNGFM